MPWFWNSSNSEDPVKKLDPGLRKYLENESPENYVPASASPLAVEEHAESIKSNSPKQDDSAPPIPSKSLFPDGRYAHLWKTYKPPAEETGAEVKTATEKVAEERNQRSALVRRAVFENCALENEILSMCYKKPDTWTQKFTQCDAENKSFNRCFATQTKFLNALGYATSAVWEDEREERIQVHADRLYHEMLDYEKQVDEAREAGREPPALTSLFNPQAKTGQSDPSQVEIPGGQPVPADLDTKGLKQEKLPGELPIPENFRFSKPLERLTPHERELELQVYYARSKYQTALEKEKAAVVRPHDENRDKRREKLVSWFGETVGDWMSR